MNKLIKISMFFLIASQFVGCSSKNAAESILKDLGKGSGQFATVCPDLNGKYQMNQDVFEVFQEKCESFNLKSIYGSMKSRGYITDGISTTINGETYKAMFLDDRLMVETIDKNGKKLNEQFLMTKTPCDLLNPDGELYLERKWSESNNFNNNDCDFWAKY